MDRARKEECFMPIPDLLERNSKLYGDEVALVEINPDVREKPRVTWKEYELIQPSAAGPYRRETWRISCSPAASGRDRKSRFS